MGRIDPAISVIIPVFNGEAFLAEAVASVRAQSLQPMEILIVDDGSEDGTPGVIDSLGSDIRSVRQPNSGPAAARNRGLDMAMGELVTFLDADDLWSERKLEKQARHLKEHPGEGLVLGATQRVRQADASGASDQRSEPIPFGAVWMLLSLGAAAVRRPVFDTVGGFDETLRQGEDVDWFIRARELGVEMGISNEVVQLYRRHDSNVTADSLEKDRSFLAVMKKSLDRRRAGGRSSADEMAAIAELANFDPPGRGDPT